MNQSKLEVITGSWRKARENACAWVTIGFGFTSDWMKTWREFLSQSCSVESAKPVTFRHSNENCSNLVWDVYACWVIVLFHDQVSVERGMSWNESLQLRRSYTHPDDGYYLSHQVSHQHVLHHSWFSVIDVLCLLFSCVCSFLHFKFWFI